MTAAVKATCASSAFPRARAISASTLTAGFEGRDALLARLGKHKVAKACLYVRRMSDVDPKVLKQLVAAAFEDRKRRHA